MIPEMYESVQKSVITEISKATSITITTDAWTSVSNESFVGVTAHYLLENFDYQNRCLTVKHAPGSHTAESMACHLEEACDEWGINHRRSELLPLYVVTDNAANVKKAVGMMTNTKWLSCFAHSLQLVVNKVLRLEELDEVKELLIAARSIVSHFRRSPMATKNLEAAQKQLNLPNHRVIQDCATRWNSQVLMLERLIEQKPAISLVLSSVSGVKNLDGDQWKAAELLVDALRPFLDVTNIVSASKYPTLSMVLPLIDGLMDILQEEATAESIPCLRAALIHEIHDRFDYIKQSEIHSIATVVDPRYKMIPFSDDLRIMQAQNSVIVAMERAMIRSQHGYSKLHFINIGGIKYVSCP